MNNEELGLETPGAGPGSPPGPAPTRLSLPAHLSRTASRTSYRARFCSAGPITTADGTPGRIVVTEDALQQAIAELKFDGLPSFIDHAGWFDHPSLRDLAGLTITSEWNPNTKSADGTISLYNNQAGKVIADLFADILADADAGEPVPNVGLSLVFWPKWKPRDNDSDPLVLDSFRHIESVDFVFQPAADGRVTEALTALSALNERSYPMETPVEYTTNAIDQPPTDTSPQTHDPAEVDTILAELESNP
ncbi:hypothetical protein ACFLWA_09530, partial [Chloroflexota bacterium]